MKRLIDIVWIALSISMMGAFMWGVDWALDNEEAQVKAGKKLPGTTILPIVTHAQSRDK